jgi:hypothetical protein
MKKLLLIIGSLFLVGCGPHAEDIAGTIRALPQERLARLEKDAKALIGKDDFKPTPANLFGAKEWLAEDGLPVEFADLKPLYVSLSDHSLNLCFYRNREHSVNLDVTWSAGPSIAVLSWGDYHSEKRETIWRSKGPNQAHTAQRGCGTVCG